MNNELKITKNEILIIIILMNDLSLDELTELLTHQPLLDKYTLLTKINKNSYIEVYKGKNINSKEPVILKIANSFESKKILQCEAQILISLKGYGIPKMLTFCILNNYNILVEKFLGEPLSFLYKNNKFNLKDVLMIGLQIIDRLEFIHNKGIIHCNIEPSNFILSPNNIIYLIDFAHSSKYLIGNTINNNKYDESDEMIFSYKYASINALEGIELSRRDDLESLTYMLIYFLKGSLPWDNLNEDDENKKYIKMYLMKKNINPLELCEGLENEFSLFLSYVRTLNFEEKPDYNYLRNLLNKIFKEYNMVNDNKFSWVNKGIKNHGNIKTKFKCSSIIKLKINNQINKKLNKTINKEKPKQVLLSEVNKQKSEKYLKRKDRINILKKKLLRSYNIQGLNSFINNNNENTNNKEIKEIINENKFEKFRKYFSNKSHKIILSSDISKYSSDDHTNDITRNSSKKFEKIKKMKYLKLKAVDHCLSKNNITIKTRINPNIFEFNSSILLPFKKRKTIFRKKKHLMASFLTFHNHKNNKRIMKYDNSDSQMKVKHIYFRITNNGLRQEK